jgi:hypothetical protein
MDTFIITNHAPPRVSKTIIPWTRYHSGVPNAPSIASARSFVSSDQVSRMSRLANRRYDANKTGPRMVCESTTESWLASEFRDIGWIMLPSAPLDHYTQFATGAAHLDAMLVAGRFA